MLIVVFSKNDEQCESKVIPFVVGNCNIENGQCQGEQCEFLINSAVKVCIKATVMNRWNKTDFSQILRFADFNGQADALCLISTQNEDYIFGNACRMLGGYCDDDTKQCIISQEQKQRKIEGVKQELYALRPYKEDEYGDEILYDKEIMDILIAIDGIYSRQPFEQNWNENKYLYFSADPRDDQANWRSHIANFFHSYFGYKFYYNGVNMIDEWIEITKDEIDVVINDDIMKQICQFLQKKKLNGLKDFNVDLVGYDKGGYIVIQVIKKLKFIGCMVNGKEMKPIIPRFVGLYDPVKSHINTVSAWYDKIQETLKLKDKDNVKDEDINQVIETKDFVVAYGDPKMYKRKMFEIIDIDTESKQYFKASHGAMGCAPDGCKEMRWIAANSDAFNKDMEIDHDTEIEGCISADEYVRSRAIKAGLPITPAGEVYYNRFQ